MKLKQSRKKAKDIIETIDAKKSSGSKITPILPVNFVVSEELPDYWIELVERQKLREVSLNEIIRVLDKKGVRFSRDKYKKEIFQALENLISFYSTKTAD